MEAENADLSANGMLKQHAFPALAAALRPQIERIINSWETAVREALSCARQLPTTELHDRVPAILADITDVLEAPSPEKSNRLIEVSPGHGLSRFNQNYRLEELLDEEMLLRPAILESAERSLLRPMTTAENVALNFAIDVALRHSAVAFTDRQHQKSRAATESEWRHLSFLSHDMSNNLSAIRVHLELLEERLSDLPGFSRELSALKLAQQSILRTTEGMQRLLTHERLRRQPPQPQVGPVPLYRLAMSLAAEHETQALKKGLWISVEISPDAVALSDSSLIALVLQNLLGNGVKHSDRGGVRMLARREKGANGEYWVLSVADEGPGIPPQHLRRIFAAFARGETQSQEGVGLGLAIAAEAARLLGAELRVESELGAGSAFHLVLPPEP